MRYLYIVLRVRNLDAGLDFCYNKLGLKQVRRVDDEKNRKPCL
jgi:catechol 2,3-dioxygenase-like lactoylglutathione lyase family enzyme